MILGTGSDVGKSVIAAGFCRLFSDMGLRVAPFKAQNMSNNSYVTEEGGEMGRAQVVQAECARIRPHVDMNPVLLKPAADNHSQVVVQGHATGHLSAVNYYAQREVIARAICESVVESATGLSPVATQQRPPASTRSNNCQNGRSRSASLTATLYSRSVRSRI